MADTMISFKNQRLANTFMTEEEIRKVCPLAYATEPTNNVTNKYVLANTAMVIEDMAKLGWGVVAAKQRKATKKSSGRFSYHMVAFQNPDVKIVKTVKNPDGTLNEEVDCYPQIIVTNSHDGMASFRFMVGCFRLVCSNGLVIATDKFADMRIRHINYTFEELQSLISKVMEELPIQIDTMNGMQKIFLTNEQMEEFALGALKIRKGLNLEDELIVDEDTITEMLTPTRDEDKGNDLWKVYNVLQEKVIRGGFSIGQEGKKARKIRKVSGFIKDLEINAKLWKLAETYMK